MEKALKNLTLSFLVEKCWQFLGKKSRYLKRSMRFSTSRQAIFPQMKMNLAIRATKSRCLTVPMQICSMSREGLMLILKVCFYFPMMGSLFIRLSAQNEIKKKNMKSGSNHRSALQTANSSKTEFNSMMATLQNQQKSSNSRKRKSSWPLQKGNIIRSKGCWKQWEIRSFISKGWGLENGL